MFTDRTSTQWFEESKGPAAIVSFDRFLDKHVFAGKNGGYGMCFSVLGIDDEARTRRDLDELVKRIGMGAIQQLPPEITVYHWALRKRGYVLPRQPHYPTPVTEHTAATRLAFLDDQGKLGAVALCWGLYINPPVGRKKPNDMAKHNVRQIRTLRNAATILRSQLSDLLTIQPMSIEEVKGFFGYLSTLEPYLSANYPGSTERVDEQLARVTVKWTEDALRIGKRFAKLFSLIQLPSGTRPNLWGELLTLDCDLVLCMEWQAHTTASTMKEIDHQETHLGILREKFASYLVSRGVTEPPRKTARNISADHTTENLGGILSDLQNKGRRYGHFSLIGMIHSRSLEDLDQIMPEIHRIFLDPAQAVVLEETDGALSAYHALYPGNQRWNVRRRWLKDEHYAHLAFPYQPFTGTAWSEDLGREYLAIFETRDRTPFFFDPYVDGLRGLLILAAPGHGKSVVGNFLVDHEQKYRGFTTVYDIGYSYAHTVLAHGGTVVSVGLDGPRMNPFGVESPDERHIHAVFNLIQTFLRKGGRLLDPRESEHVVEKIRMMWLFPPGLRRLKHLRLPPSLDPYLSQWVEGGIYGNLFDNVEDQLELTRLQAFDFEDVGEEYKLMMEPTLYWLTYLKNRQRHDPQNLDLPKHDVFDELHKHLQNPQMWEYIRMDLKTARKHLGGVTLLTHHIDDLGTNAALIKNTCPMTLFLGGDVDRERYAELFRLSDHELDVIESLKLTEGYLKTPRYGKVIILNLDRRSLAMYTTRPKDRAARNRLIQQHGQEKGMELFTRELTA